MVTQALDGFSMRVYVLIKCFHPRQIMIAISICVNIIWYFRKMAAQTKAFSGMLSCANMYTCDSSNKAVQGQGSFDKKC